MKEAFSKKKHRNESVTDHIGELETVFIQLENVGTLVNELMQIAILLSSVKGDNAYVAVIAAIRTMDKTNTSWNVVPTRLIDEYEERE